MSIASTQATRTRGRAGAPRLKTRGALLWEPGTRSGWSVEEIEFDPPRAGEVLVKLAATGLCHSDYHLDAGDVAVPYKPALGGHEAAGVVVEVGPGVTTLAEGDHVVTTIPACGRCPSCGTGRGNLCDLGEFIQAGVQMSDLTYRRWVNGDVPVGAVCQIGAFSPYVVTHEVVCVKIPEHIPLEKAALLGCAVITGWGSAVYRAETQPGDTVAVLGVGGLGINAVQGARMAGATTIVAIDLVEWKREKAREFGATHTAASAEEAQELLRELTRGRMAERAIVTVSLATGDILEQAVALTGKGGVTVITGLAPEAQRDVKLDLFMLTLWEKEIRGSCAGGIRIRHDIPRLLRYYEEGVLQLDEQITRTYTLDEINQGYQDMLEGRNLRGLIVFD